MSISQVPTTSSGVVAQAPLSFNQEFLCLYDRGDTAGPFGPAYHIVHGWRVRGPVDVETLRLALADVVARHEALRTVVVRGDQPRQEILAASPPELSIQDLPGVDPEERDDRAERLLIDVEAADFPLRVPLLRGLLARFDERDAVLVLVSHHSATDGWSMRLIVRDLANRYAARRGHQVPDLPSPGQYREFVQWQQVAVADAEAMRPSREYWREQLRDAQIFTFRTDRPRSADAAQVTSMHRFLIDAELTQQVLKLGKATRSSPFMVLLGAFNLLAQKLSGATDIAVPTFTPGRGGERFEHTVGSFFNFIPVRTDLSRCGSFREMVTQIRDTCVDAYSHDIPQILAEAPELMLPAIQDDQAPCVFQVFPFPFLLDNEPVGDLRYSEIRRRLVSQERYSLVPDGQLWTLNLDPVGDVIGSVSYQRNLFDPATVTTAVSEFVRLLSAAVAAPDAPLKTDRA